MKTTAWLSKRLAIINQFWLVKFGNRFNMSTPSHKGFFSMGGGGGGGSLSETHLVYCMAEIPVAMSLMYLPASILYAMVRILFC